MEEGYQKINEIDDKIAALYAQRMALVKQNGVNGLQARDTINRVTKDADEDLALFTKQLFNTVYDTAVAYNYRTMKFNPSSIVGEIREAVGGKEKAFPTRAGVACQGVEGAYSSIAAERLFPIADIMFFKNFENVFFAVEKGLCEYGVLPIENSTVGSVNAVYDLMKEHKFYVVRRIKLRVQHYLLAPKGVKAEDITDIYSHEQAISQCAQLIKDMPSVKVHVVENTAVAAQTVAADKTNHAACICSRECADLYNLSVVKANVQDNANNYTRFICISKQMEIFDKADKISLMISVPNQPGSLTKIINKFSAMSLNMTKLQSRPLSNTDFEFLFYFDFDADIKVESVQKLLIDLESVCEQFTFLGAYSDVN